MQLYQQLFSFIICGVIWVTVSTAPDDCPAKEDIHPCTCRLYSFETVITCDGLSTVDEVKKLSAALQGSGKYTLMLLNSDISNVPKDVLQGTSIVKLALENSEILTIGGPEDPDLAGLEDSLRFLTILESYKSKERPMPALYLSHLKKLERLTEERNYIPELGNDFFKNAPVNLKYLRLSSNSIQKLGDKAFANFKNVEQFRLGSEKMQSTLSRSMFPKPALILESLDLTNLGLTSLPDDFFSEMPKLQFVDLYKNEMTTISESVWSPIWNHLLSLTLYENPLECDSNIKWLFFGKDYPTVQILATCHKPEHLNDLPFEMLKLSDIE